MNIPSGKWKSRATLSLFFYLRLAISPAILYFVTTTSSAMVGSSSSAESFPLSAILTKKSAYKWTKIHSKMAARGVEDGTQDSLLKWRVIFFLGYSGGGHSTTLPSGERNGLCRLRSCDARLRGRRFVKWQKISIETLYKRFNIDCSIVNSLFLSVWSWEKFS